ncbi:QOR, partial [Symbiodinium sp. CCMP2456]
AWRVHSYGKEGNPAHAISNMTLNMVPVPEPRKGQVLVKVQMAAVNPVDWKLFGGGMHSIFPVSFPYVPGFDIAGTVVKVGEGVTRLAVGDEICGDIGLRETCCHDTQAPWGTCQPGMPWRLRTLLQSVKALAQKKWWVCRWWA